MNFEDTPEEAIFRSEVRAWLQANAPDYVGVTDTDLAREWQAKKAAAGYAAITWPKEYGGLGGTPIQAVIYGQEESKWDLPWGIFSIGLGNCIPTLITYGTEEDKLRYVRPALRGEEIWCQLFSEPAAGSDLAGIRTKAVRDGDDWVINGQKIWTSDAQVADFGCLVVRSDPDQPKHKGMSYFFLDMKSPGVEIRPIKQMNGGSDFNEVFFTDVRIPDSQRLGAVNEGFKVALTTLMNERFGVDPESMGGPGAKEMIELARSVTLEDGRPAIENALIRHKIAHWHIALEGLKYSRFRALTALSKGETPGPDGSIAKLVLGLQGQEIALLATDLQEAGGAIIDAGAAATDTDYIDAFLSNPGMRIAGGTDEILLNTIAERVLGLPAEIRVDKDVPFRDLPTGVA